MMNGHLNMDLILERFVVHFHDIYGDRDEKFIEKEGRKYFLFISDQLLMESVIMVDYLSS